MLQDGVLAWCETVSSTSTGRFVGTVTTVTGIKAAALGSTSTVSSLSAAILYGAGPGQLLLGESGKVYSWNAATRSDTARKNLMINKPPPPSTDPKIAGNAALEHSTVSRQIGGAQRVPAS